MLVLASSCHKKDDGVNNNATTLPDNYFSASVDGNNITGSTSGADRGFTASFSDTTTHNKIIFTVEDWYTGPGIFSSAPVGKYQLATGAYKNGAFYASYATVYLNNKVYHTDANNTGTLSITSTAGKTITGTFNINAIDSNGNKVSINSGVFNKVSL